VGSPGLVDLPLFFYEGFSLYGIRAFSGPGAQAWWQALGFFPSFFFLRSSRTTKPALFFSIQTKDISSQYVTGQTSPSPSPGLQTYPFPVVLGEHNKSPLGPPFLHIWAVLSG